MSYNPSSEELLFLFDGVLDKSSVMGIYNDVHCDGTAALEILSQLGEKLFISNNLKESKKKSFGMSNGSDSSNWRVGPRGPNTAQYTGHMTQSNQSQPMSDQSTYNPVTDPFYTQPSTSRRAHGYVPFSHLGGGVASSAGTITPAGGERQERGPKKTFHLPGADSEHVLYILRGLTGSGKSSLARRIVSTMKRGHIFSTDDFFYNNAEHEYRFELGALEEAHMWNQRRCFEAMRARISPVIIDNTNTQFWEMRPYVLEAIEQGYEVHFMEPTTPWKFSPKTLYKKSTHGVAKDRIERGLSRWEKNPTVEKVAGCLATNKPNTKNSNKNSPQGSQTTSKNTKNNPQGSQNFSKNTQGDQATTKNTKNNPQGSQNSSKNSQGGQNTKNSPQQGQNTSKNPQGSQNTSKNTKNNPQGSQNTSKNTKNNPQEGQTVSKNTTNNPQGSQNSSKSNTWRKSPHTVKSSYSSQTPNSTSQKPIKSLMRGGNWSPISGHSIVINPNKLGEPSGIKDLSDIPNATQSDIPNATQSDIISQTSNGSLVPYASSTDSFDSDHLDTNHCDFLNNVSFRSIGTRSNLGIDKHDREHNNNSVSPKVVSEKEQEQNSQHGVEEIQDLLLENLRNQNGLIFCEEPILEEETLQENVTANSCQEKDTLDIEEEQIGEEKDEGVVEEENEEVVPGEKGEDEEVQMNHEDRGVGEDEGVEEEEEEEEDEQSSDEDEQISDEFEGALYDPWDVSEEDLNNLPKNVYHDRSGVRSGVPTLVDCCVMILKRCLKSSHRYRKISDNLSTKVLPTLPAPRPLNTTSTQRRSPQTQRFKATNPLDILNQFIVLQQEENEVLQLPDVNLIIKQELEIEQVQQITDEDEEEEDEEEDDEDEEKDDEEEEEENTGNENMHTDLCPEKRQIIHTVSTIFDSYSTQSLLSACEECLWDVEEITNYLLLQESVKEIAEETMREVKEEIRYTDIEEATEQHIIDFDQSEECLIGSITLPSSLVQTLTQMFGTVFNIPPDEAVHIPINTLLGSHLHAALCNAQTKGLIKYKKDKRKGKEKLKFRAQFHPVPKSVSPEVINLSEIMERAQSKKTSNGSKVQRLFALFPGIEESFLESILESCGGDLLTAVTALKQEYTGPIETSVYQPLYSEMAETQPITEQSGYKEGAAQYTHLQSIPPQSQYSSILSIHLPSQSQHNLNQVIPPCIGSLEEKAKTYHQLSQQKYDQSHRAHSNKQGTIATYYAEEARRLKSVAQHTDQTLFQEQVKIRCQEAERTKQVDLHGLTLPQSKFLVEAVIDHLCTLNVTQRGSDAAQRDVGHRGSDVGHRGTEVVHLYIITGKGIHSAGGVSKLKLGIKGYLSQYKHVFQELDDGFKVKI